MTQLWWMLRWVFKAMLFFALFAFSLNNQHTVTVHGFFGAQWQAPLVLVVLCAVGLGVGVAVVAMVPRWWRSRPTNPVVASSVPPRSHEL
jgi:putative membrane protein